MCLKITHNGDNSSPKFLAIKEKYLDHKSKHPSNLIFFAIKSFRADERGRLLSNFIIDDETSKLYAYKFNKNGWAVRNNAKQKIEFLLATNKEFSFANDFYITSSQTSLGYHITAGTLSEYKLYLERISEFYNSGGFMEISRFFPSTMYGFNLLVKFRLEDVQLYDGQIDLVVKTFAIATEQEIEAISKYLETFEGE